MNDVYVCSHIHIGVIQNLGDAHRTCLQTVAHFSAHLLMSIFYIPLSVRLTDY